MPHSYWDNVLRFRISRRRSLMASGAGLTTATLLAACGSDNQDGGSSTGSGGSGSSTGLIASPSKSEGKPGGVLKDFYAAELTHMDALLSNSASTVNLISVFAYPRLLKFTIHEAPKTNDGGETEGEVAQSVEKSPDGLTYTFKLRQGMLWDKRAPTNGRVLDTDDVLFSWKKFAAVNASAPNFVYDSVRAPGAAVESISAPDKSTIVMKLRRPEAALLTLLAGWDQLYIMPRESDGGFDPKTNIRGHGPWILDAFVPSSHTHWARNPDYYNKGRPFPDRLERALVPEYATRLAQFKAGNIHTFVAANEDIVQAKRDVPKSVIYQDQLFNSMTSAPNISFGYEGNSIFRDTRVRQAMSMALDRDAFANVMENIDKFAADGIDIEWGINTHLSPGWGDYWLDPKDASKFGPDVKYLEFHPDQSKSLLSAAGHANGVEFDFYHNSEATYGAAYRQQVEIIQASLEEVGLKGNLKGMPYAQWLANYHYGYTPAKYESGEVQGFNGIGLTAERTRYTPALSIFGLMHPEGDAFHGAVPANGQGSPIKGDPVLNDMLAKFRLETNREAAIKQSHDVQRYIAKNANYIPKPSNSKPLRLMWPAIANAYVYNSSSVGRNLWAENYINWWLDTTKAPFV